MSDTAITAIAGVITAIVALVSTYLTAWLRQKYGSEKFYQYTRKAEEIVSAAEQLGGIHGWTSEQKYDYASDRLANWTGVTPDQARILIESAVRGIWKPYVKPAEVPPPTE
jgi:hypothetical protein